MTLLEKAEQIARAAHAGQYRYGGEPYINHPLAVAAKVESEDAKAVALLHDVLEDTTIRASDLYNAGIPVHIVEAVLVLTKDDCEPYGAYLNRIKVNYLARVVKLADMEHNLADKPTVRAATKYRTGIRFLAFGDVIDESRAGIGDAD